MLRVETAHCVATVLSTCHDAANAKHQACMKAGKDLSQSLEITEPSESSILNFIDSIVVESPAKHDQAKVRIRGSPILNTCLTVHKKMRAHWHLTRHQYCHHHFTITPPPCIRSRRHRRGCLKNSYSLLRLLSSGPLNAPALTLAKLLSRMYLRKRRGKCHRTSVVLFSSRWCCITICTGILDCNINHRTHPAPAKFHFPLNTPWHRVTICTNNTHDA
jgi:hypothetical protein